MPVILSEGHPVETAPGNGDLDRSSVPFDVFAGGPFWMGRPVSYAKIFQTQPWVAIAVMRLLTWSVRVPLKAYERIDDDEVRRLHPDDHTLAAALAQPWDRGYRAALVQAMLGPLLVHGNSLVDVHEGARGALRFEPMDWRMVAPIRLDEEDPNAEILGWKFRQGRTETDRSADTVMHLRWWSPLGQLGISPLEQVRMSVLSDQEAARWAMANLKQGIKPQGLLQLSDEFLGRHRDERQWVMDKTGEAFVKKYGGHGGAGVVPVLPPGLTYTAAEQTTAVEAQLIQQRMVYRNEVGAIYMIPPPMIGQLDKSSFNNIATQREMAYTDGLAPPLVLGEQVFNAHVSRGLLRQPEIFVEFDFAGILRGDRLKEIQALREAIGSMLLTPNEGRAVLNYPSSDLENADKLWGPVNNARPIDSLPPLKGA